MSTDNFSQITPAAARAIADSVRQTQQTPSDSRGPHNPWNSTFRRNFYFPVLVSVDGGEAGSMASSQNCTFTYSLFDLDEDALKDDSDTPITNLTPDAPRFDNCKYDRPDDLSPGVAYYHADGTMQLLWAVKEKPSGVVYTAIVGLQISGTAIQYQTNTALVLDQGTPADWITLDSGTTCPS